LFLPAEIVSADGHLVRRSRKLCRRGSADIRRRPGR